MKLSLIFVAALAALTGCAASGTDESVGESAESDLSKASVKILGEMMVGTPEYGGYQSAESASAAVSPAMPAPTTVTSTVPGRDDVVSSMVSTSTTYDAGRRPAVTDQAADFSRMCTPQAEPRPMTWARPTFAPSIWRGPASPRRWWQTSQMLAMPVAEMG